MGSFTQRDNESAESGGKMTGLMVEKKLLQLNLTTVGVYEM